MWELENKKGWVPKNWWFWTMVLEKTFESPLATRRSNQLILKEISPESSLEGLMLKLKLQYLGHLMQTHWKRPWYWERLKAGGEGDGRGWGGRMASPTRWTWVWANSRMVKDKEAWHAAVHGAAKILTWLINWTTELLCISSMNTNETNKNIYSV